MKTTTTVKYALSWAMFLPVVDVTVEVTEDDEEYLTIEQTPKETDQ